MPDTSFFYPPDTELYELAVVQWREDNNYSFRLPEQLVAVVWQATKMSVAQYCSTLFLTGVPPDFEGWYSGSRLGQCTRKVISNPDI